MLEETSTHVGRRTLGIAIAALTAVISGFAVFINGYGVRAWADVSDAATYTTFKNMVAAGVLGIAAFALARRRSTEAVRRPDSSSQWLRLGLIAVIGGSVPFVLFFEGLSRASSGQAAFIHKTLVVWVGIMAVVFLRERVGPLHVVAIALLVWGQAVLLGGIADLSLGSGEAMMLAATFLWAVETVVAKRLLGDMSAMTVAIARMAGGAALLVIYGLIRGAFADLGALGFAHIAWVLVTGAVLSGYVASWYLALARAQAIDVTAVLVGGAVITAALNVGVRGLALPHLGGIGLVAAGVAIVFAASLLRNREVPAR